MQLGAKVKDKITGFSGIATGYVTYISGCNQVLVTPPVGKDGKLVESQWLDEQRLDRVGSSTILLNNDNGRGFDREPPKR